MTADFDAKRLLLYAFLATLAALAAIGIFVLLLGQFGALEFRVLSTTTVIGVASIIALAALAAIDGARNRRLAQIAITAITLALLLSLALIWELAPPWPYTEYVQRSAAAAWVIGVALPHAALLRRARLHRDHEWVRIATLCSNAALALLLLSVIALDLTDDLVGRLIGVGSLLVVCGTVAVPALHYVSRISAPKPVTTELRLQIVCPRCGIAQQVSVGSSRCACGLRFRIEIEEENCPACGYSLYRCTAAACPECGAPIAGANPRPAERVSAPSA